MQNVDILATVYGLAHTIHESILVKMYYFEFIYMSLMKHGHITEQI